MNPFTPKQEMVIVGLLVVSFAFGRFSAQKPEVKTEVDTHQQAQIDATKDTHTQTTTTTVKTPDGAIKIIKTTDTVVSSHKETTKESDKHIEQTVKPAGSKVNLSVLVAEDFSRRPGTPSYGLSVQKEFLGPLTIGAFGLNNGTIGLSLGVNF